MRPQTQVVTVNRKYKVHTEFYANPQASRTIILVNGSLATTASFAQTVKYLHPQFNVVLYDQPYAGQSKPHNDHGSPVTKEAEAEILLALIEHHQVDYVSSFSWGGVATLLALSQNPARIRKAVINSFSPVLNEPMLDYLRNGMTHLQALDRENVAQLVNATIGRYLPALFKRFNHKHVASLDDHEYLQMHFHIRQVLNLDAHCYVDCLQAVDIPCCSSTASTTSTPPLRTPAASPATCATASSLPSATLATSSTWSTRPAGSRPRTSCWASSTPPPAASSPAPSTAWARRPWPYDAHTRPPAPDAGGRQGAFHHGRFRGGASFRPRLLVKSRPCKRASYNGIT